MSSLLLLTPGDPPAHTDYLPTAGIGPSAGHRWRVRGFTFHLVTDATAGVRHPSLVLKDGGGTARLRIPLGVGIPASKVVDLTAWIGAAANPNNQTDIVVWASLPDLWLPVDASGAWRWTTVTGGVFSSSTSDQYSNMNVLYEDDASGSWSAW